MRTARTEGGGSWELSSLCSRIKAVVGNIPLSKIIHNLSFRYTQYINHQQQKMGLVQIQVRNSSGVSWINVFPVWVFFERR
jgi:hypothetical protein